MMKTSTLSRRQKISRKSQAQIRRSMELAMLEPRMLFCALHDGGLDDLPSNLGTFPPIQSDLNHTHADLDTDYPGAAADTSGGATAAVSGATIPVSISAVPVLHSNASATAKL